MYVLPYEKFNSVSNVDSLFIMMTMLTFMDRDSSYVLPYLIMANSDMHSNSFPVLQLLMLLVTASSTIDPDL